MPGTKTAIQKEKLTLEEWRERRRLRREKQRESNILRAAKMHKARLKMEADGVKPPSELKASVFVGCSGWRYWKWRDLFYDGVPQPEWFKHYSGVLTQLRSTPHFTHGRRSQAFRPGVASRAARMSSTR
jgi:hypothetical protein